MPKESFHDDFESQVRLLEPQSDEELLFQKPHPGKNPTTWTLYRRLENLSLWRFTYLLLVHIALLAVSIAFLRERKVEKPANEGYEGFSPAREVISYEIASTWPGNHDGHHASYSGSPSTENNRAWDALTRPMFFNASKEEMIAAGESLDDSVQLEDGSYLASTRVHHDVHCLRQIRLFIYKETYYPSLTKPQELYLRHHIDHCIEAIRMSLMCTGDVSLYTFFWHDPPGEKPGTKTNSRRSCIKWEGLQDWSEKRMIPKNANVIRPEVD